MSEQSSQQLEQIMHLQYVTLGFIAAIGAVVYTTQTGELGVPGSTMFAVGLLMLAAFARSRWFK